MLGLIPGMPQLRVPAARRRPRLGWPGGCSSASQGAAAAAAAMQPRRRCRRPMPEASWDDVDAGGRARAGGRLPADPAGGQGRRTANC
ncbi:MAG: hypothetical protein MZW92_52300 [Comamonadaceae bacterium]|nr:hypothetical protein [Comamonadaceae bacterium]